MHIPSSNRSWTACSTQALKWAKNIHVVNRLELKKIIFYRFPKWVFVTRQIERNDASGNQNVNMSTVSGSLTILLWGSWPWMAYNMSHINPEVLVFVPKICLKEFKSRVGISALLSMKGYDAGFIKDEYGCNSNKCECANFDEIVIGKTVLFWSSCFKTFFRRHCSIWKDVKQIDEDQ